MNRVMWMLLVGLFIVAGNVQAHCGHCGVGDGPKAEKKGKSEATCDWLDQVSQDLKLTAEQKTQVESIMKEKMEKKQQIIEQKEAAMKALHEDVQVKLKGVLSDEQMKKWEEKKGGCPLCKDGKPCDKCKGKMKGHCPDCKDGKPCKKCQEKMKGHCPDCKDGKPCKKCKLKVNKKK